MNEQDDLLSALGELKKLTGLELQLAAQDDLPEDAAEKLTMLTSAWREKYDRSNFLRNLLHGNVSETDLYAAASRFHIQEQGRRILYVIELKGSHAKVAERILKQAFVSGSGDLFAVLDDQHMVLIKPLGPRDNEKDCLSQAHTIVDMLNTEAMIRARVGYTAPFEYLKELPDAFRSSSLALRIGGIFYSRASVLQYNELGIGRLIYDLPEDSCRLFLREVFGDESPDDFDEETVQIINAFFENNLNISETARQLYVHRNTLVYRLEKLRQATGLDLRSFDDAVELKIAMMIATCLKAKA